MRKAIAVMLALAFVFAACGKDDAATASSNNVLSGGETVYEFKMDIPEPPESIACTFLYSWAEQVKEASGGRINITVYPDSQLGAASEIIDNLKKGVNDLAWASPDMFPGRFPVTEGANLPMLNIPNYTVGTDFLNELYLNTALMQKEYEGIYPLAIYAGPSHYLAAGKGKTIRALADLRGMKVGVQGSDLSLLLTQLGAEPIDIPSSELYDALEKGVIDGYLSDLTTVGTWDLADVTGQVATTQICRFEAFLLMNPDSYNKLPDDLKAILDEYSSKQILAYGLGQAFDDGANLDMESYVQTGMATSEFSEEDIAVIRTAAETVAKQWVKKMDGVSYDGQAVLDTYNRILGTLK